MTSESGKLYIVATPIGNLNDITFRAVDTLKKVDLILCEDSRVTKKLLNKYDIKTKLETCHKFSEEKIKGEILEKLNCGIDVALVSDAGTPLISDPGSRLVSACRNENISVVTIPGASALVSALSILGLNFNDFLFVGYLPEKKSKRRELIESFENRSNYIVLYVAPHDLKKYVKEISEVYRDVKYHFARELTKVYEETWSGTGEELTKRMDEKEIKGEVVLVLEISSSLKEVVVDLENILLEMKAYINEGNSLKEASKFCAKKYDLKSSDLYNLFLKKTTA